MQMQSPLLGCGTLSQNNGDRILHLLIFHIALPQLLVICILL